AGFEAYLGNALRTPVTGLYHLGTNRFVMYDFGQNRNYIAARRQAEQRSRQFTLQLDRQRYLGAVQRRARDLRSDTNVNTIMHEVAHQLSFNTGMLNRHADVPLWLAEGLACYCESSQD